MSVFLFQRVDSFPVKARVLQFATANMAGKNHEYHHGAWCWWDEASGTVIFFISQWNNQVFHTNGKHPLFSVESIQRCSKGHNHFS